MPYQPPPFDPTPTPDQMAQALAGVGGQNQQAMGMGGMQNAFANKMGQMPLGMAGQQAQGMGPAGMQGLGALGGMPPGMLNTPPPPPPPAYHPPSAGPMGGGGPMGPGAPMGGGGGVPMTNPAMRAPPGQLGGAMPPGMTSGQIAPNISGQMPPMPQRDPQLQSPWQGNRMMNP